MKRGVAKFCWQSEIIFPDLDFAQSCGDALYKNQIPLLEREYL